MYIFLSHASEHKNTVRPVCANLRAAGFEVFFDETDLPPGDVYDDRIREAVQRSDLFIFMLSPEAVTPGRYTLTELLFAAARWPSPCGRVLAVLPLATPEPPLPDYLKPLTIQKQVGNLAAEVLATVRRMEASASAAAATVPVPAAVPAAAAAATDSPSLAPAPTAQAVEATGATYESLDIRFQAHPPDGYAMRLEGAAVAEATPLPIGAEPAALEQALWLGATPAAGVTRRGVPAAFATGLLPTAEAARQVGQQLHALLFAPALRDRLQVPMRRIDRQRRHGLRFVIDTTDAPALARLPWEFTCDPKRGEFLFADTMKPVVRWLDVDELLPTLAVQPPLHVLIAVASPSDRPALAVGDELAHLDRALAELSAQGLVRTERLEHASLARLDQALLDSRPHVLHFVGHGDFAGNEGTVLFESDESPGMATPVTGQRLAVLLRNHLQSLRLVFLNSCMGATASARDPFGGVAQALVGHGVPAVIAMQFPIPDASAIALARHFYRYLAAGRPVDESLTAARAFLFAQGLEVEWGAPVLTMRSPDGRLFDIGDVRPAAPAPAPPPEPPPAVRPPEPTEGPGPVTRSSRPTADRRRWWAVGGVLLVLAAAWFGYSGLRTGSIDLPSQPQPTSGGPVAPIDPGETALQAALRESRERLGTGDAAAALATLERALPTAGQPARISPALVPELQAQLLALTERATLDQFDRLLSLGDVLGGSQFQARLMDRMMELHPPGAGVEPGTGPRAGGSYVVRRGDTLWFIARKRYGDPTRWPQILQDNAQPVRDPDRLRPGQVLLIPAHPAAVAGTEHVVRPGDSLWRLAAHYYGDGRLWPRLQAANAESVRNPGFLKPGQTLRIPAAR